MKLIRQSVEGIHQSRGFGGILKQIEAAGRTCYKSEDLITEGSAEKFVGMLRTHEHGSVLEHGTIYLKIPIPNDQKEIDGGGESGKSIGTPHKTHDFYTHNKYSVVYGSKLRDFWYVITNYRVLVESGREDDLQFLCDPAAGEIPARCRRYSLRAVCSRAIANELVRHRVFSFSQESTRYCNYSKNKFGNEITFVYPSGFGDHDDAGEAYQVGLSNAEMSYMELLKTYSFPPERARDVLPLATKTELVMTGSLGDWEHFLTLRLSPRAHPDMRELARLMRDALNELLVQDGYVIRVGSLG